MDLTLTMTKDVDLENYYEKEKEEDLLEVKNPFGLLILDLEDSSYLELLEVFIGVLELLPKHLGTSSVVSAWIWTPLPPRTPQVVAW